jgi:hypothetical protein
MANAQIVVESLARSMSTPSHFETVEFLAALIEPVNIARIRRCEDTIVSNTTERWDTARKNRELDAQCVEFTVISQA